MPHESILVSEILADIQSLLEIAETAIQYSEKITELQNLQEITKANIKNHASYCHILCNKYKDVLSRDVLDENFIEMVAEMELLLRDESRFCYIFIINLDVCLRIFGNGPEFYEPSVMYAQPFRIH